jgi:glycosyltransferase involved in cell wall biosynthesis
MTKLVTVIMPCYNAERFVGEAIQSVKRQTYPRVELVVVDDGSSDRSLSEIKDNLGANDKLILQANSGASAARNRGLAIATGDYIQYLDADDLLSHDKIERQVVLLERAEGCVAVCDTRYFYSREELDDPIPREPNPYHFDSDDPAEFLIRLWGGDGPGSMIPLSAYLTPREVVAAAGPWGDFVLDDDGEYFARVLLASRGVRYERLSLNYYRRYHKSSSLSSRRDRYSVESLLKCAEAKAKNFLDVVSTERARRAIAKHFAELAFLAYPSHISVSRQAEARARQLGCIRVAYRGGRALQVLSKIVGWRCAKRLSHYRSKFRNSAPD